MNILYIDIYFFLNFTVNYILLLLVECIMKTGSKKIRICSSSMIVALLSVLNLKLNHIYPATNFITNYIVLTSLLIISGLRIKNIRMFIKGYISLCLSTIFVGGFLLIFEPFLAVGSLFFFLLICTYFIVYGILNFVNYQLKDSMNTLQVTLYIGRDKYSLAALYDTGNTLKDPESGKAVSIISGNTGASILENYKKDTREIPFQTISGMGMIDILTIDKMYIDKGKEKIWVVHPCVGLVGNSIAMDNKYEAILNSEII